MTQALLVNYVGYPFSSLDHDESDDAFNAFDHLDRKIDRDYP